MQLRILGPVDIYDDVRGRGLSPGGAKQRTLFALLVVRAGRTTSLYRLIEEIWGEDTPQNATNALQAHVARLRKMLAEAGADGERLCTDPTGYALRLRPGESDAERFQRLSGTARSVAGDQPERAGELFREALALWRGTAFDGCALGPVLTTEAGLLQEQRLCVQEGLYDTQLTLGRHGELVGELEEASAAHPLRERFQDQLMVALYRCGRQSEAIGVYDRTRRALLRELGVEPGPALRGRMQAVLNHSPALMVPGRPALVRAEAEPASAHLTREIDQLRTRMNSLVQQQEALVRAVSQLSAASGF
ncbi:AfsR/SARP family transcriptional regulator [Couchioplanes azureus]|uniref:AfsR/SARP family transcriptional regulator n=1 Tax=Couchioplanes caeruleus TaxID=56438 RepID=UPI0016710D23|nr:AfsR/SARP family transcriptional regulator [Couchioplanes caeruleus]GGQ76298.1 hypothetical protein GCM10010166_53120 [Couchioplanes caeruleus subsp. azureus]